MLVKLIAAENYCVTYLLYMKIEMCSNERTDRTQVPEVSQSIIGVEGAFVAESVRYQGKKGQNGSRTDR
jgi:hypothetical protein